MAIAVYIDIYFFNLSYLYFYPLPPTAFKFMYDVYINIVYLDLSHYPQTHHQWTAALSKLTIFAWPYVTGTLSLDHKNFRVKSI